MTQYFWPESFRINDLCLGLKERGYNVIVLTGRPNYPGGSFYSGYAFFNKSYETWNGIRIYRSWLIPRGNGKGPFLVVNYFSFAFFASFRALFIKEKIDKIFVFQTSPITVGIPAIVAKWKSKAPIFFWVQDLWPASVSAAGGIKSKFILSVIEHMTKVIYKHSNKILVQSKAFIPYIMNQGVSEDKLVYYPNSTESYFVVLEPRTSYLAKLSEGFNVMFAGNIGEAQSFNTIIQAALIVKRARFNINWIILGEGRLRKQMQMKIRDLELENEFKFLGSFPTTEMPHFFACSDVLLASLKKSEIFSLTIPSKIQSYLACGKPIIGSLDGIGASIILEAEAGYCSPAEDASLLAQAVIKLYKLPPNERRTLGLNGRRYFENEFEREVLLNKLQQILLFQKS